VNFFRPTRAPFRAARGDGPLHAAERRCLLARLVDRVVELVEPDPSPVDAVTLPPPSVNPPIRVEETRLPVVARPCAWVWWSNRRQVVPPCASARQLLGSTRVAAIAERLSTSPPSQVENPLGAPVQAQAPGRLPPRRDLNTALPPWGLAKAACRS
jgi:hypothetical protein